MKSIWDNLTKERITLILLEDDCLVLIVFYETSVFKKFQHNPGKISCSGIWLTLNIPEFSLTKNSGKKIFYVLTICKFVLFFSV